jgi:prephenate dehydrogenase
MRPGTVGVFAIGAIGGSVARRAKQRGVPLVLGWSPDPAKRVAAAREGVVDDAPAHGAELGARCDLWEAVCGCHTVIVDAGRHDAIAADAAQLGTLAAAAVALSVARRLPAGTSPGRGVREVTGAARDAVTPDMESLWQNRDYLRGALLGVGDSVARLVEALGADGERELEAALAAAARWRAALDP